MKYEEIYNIGKNISGPVFTNFVLWLLHTAQEKKITILYFFARDGFLLYLIAKYICEKCDIDIECRYLYCSRKALRIPTYHFIDDQERKSLIYFTYGVDIALDSVINRTGLTVEEFEQVKKNLNISIDNNKKLSTNDYADLCNIIDDDILYKETLFKTSKKAYKNIIEYLKQEKVFAYDKIGIVDSGWSGSMQRSLRQILEHNNHKCSITGFYFGLFKTSNDKRDGEYLGWYFDENNNFINRLLFYHYVVECLLSAPHETTIGYAVKESKWQPVMEKSSDEYLYSIIELHIKGVMDYIYSKDIKTFILYFDNNVELKKTSRILRRFMIFPKRREVNPFINFLFKDDLFNDKKKSLAGYERLELLDTYLISYKIKKKLFNYKNNFFLLWPCGSAVYLGGIRAFWYRVNILFGDLIREIKERGI